MPRPKPKHPKTPVTVRLAPELINMVAYYAGEHELSVNAAYERLLWAGLGAAPADPDDED